MRKLALMLALLFGLGVIATTQFTQAQDKKPKYSIKEVMKKAMKGGLCKKTAQGKASKAEKEQLVALFTALSQNKPPRGDAKSWKAKTDALVAAAKACAAGKKGGEKALKKAANCGACHKAHKGK